MHCVLLVLQVAPTKQALRLVGPERGAISSRTASYSGRIYNLSTTHLLYCDKRLTNNVLEWKSYVEACCGHKPFSAIFRISLLSLYLQRMRNVQLTWHKRERPQAIKNLPRGRIKNGWRRMQSCSSFILYQAIQVRLLNELQLSVTQVECGIFRYPVTDRSFSLPVNVSPTDLSDLINQLLKGASMCFVCSSVENYP